MAPPKVKAKVAAPEAVAPTTPATPTPAAEPAKPLVLAARICTTDIRIKTLDFTDEALKGTLGQLTHIFYGPIKLVNSKAEGDKKGWIEFMDARYEAGHSGQSKTQANQLVTQSLSDELFNPKKVMGIVGQLIGLRNKYKGIKLILSLGENAAKQALTKLLNNEEAASQIVDALVEFITKYGFDGMELKLAADASTKGKAMDVYTFFQRLMTKLPRKQFFYNGPDVEGVVMPPARLRFVQERQPSETPATGVREPSAMGQAFENTIVGLSCRCYEPSSNKEFSLREMEEGLNNYQIDPASKQFVHRATGHTVLFEDKATRSKKLAKVKRQGYGGVIISNLLDDKYEEPKRMSYTHQAVAALKVADVPTLHLEPAHIDVLTRWYVPDPLYFFPSYLPSFRKSLELYPGEAHGVWYGVN